MTKTYEKIREKIVDRFPELEEENKEEKLEWAYQCRLHKQMDDEDTLAVVSGYNSLLYRSYFATIYFVENL